MKFRDKAGRIDLGIAMIRRIIIILLFNISTASCDQLFHKRVSAGITYENEYTIVGDRNFLSGYPAGNDDGTVNVVVEIPAGTNQNWEVTIPDGKMKWEFKNGKPRVIKYLSYPGNYGMIPMTILPKEAGGDGDPLDVLLLDPSAPRGSVVRARAIGLLKFMDDGEQDDKILGIPDDSPFLGIGSISELDENFPGVVKIVEIWFANYKGANRIELKGYGESSEARQLIDMAADAFRNEQKLSK